jgi:hypothetical protein
MVWAWAVISTFCAALATFRVRFAVGFSLTFNRIWVRTVFSNPFNSAVTEYTPGGIETNRYRPSLSDLVANLYPFSSSTRVTFAPWMTAADESVRMPLIVPK